ncbi:MAG: hypothetical protein ACRENI_13500 [Gemmatimonadaceae bacterium]
MTRTLPAARNEFITAMKRDTVDTERPRFLAVLDAMIAWSAAHSAQLRFRAGETRPGVVSFERVGSKDVFWAACPKKRDTPRLELIPRAARTLGAEQRAAAANALNAHSRETLSSDDPLRIGFGALKNGTARAAVLALMDQLLMDTSPASSASREAPARAAAVGS